MPVLTNLFGTPSRVARALGVAGLADIRAFGEVLAQLKEPEPPRGMKELWGRRDLIKTLWSMAPAVVRIRPASRWEEGDDVDLSRLPIQHCWPGDVAPLVTWGLTITRGPHKARQNLGIYRQQVIGKNQLIMRWLAHRGGALDFAEHGRQNPGQPYPVAVAIGADPATILGAVTPVPDTCPNTSLPACCAARAPRWRPPSACRCRCRPMPRSCSKATSSPMPCTPAAGSTRWKGRTATTPATTTSAPSSRCSPSSASRARRGHLPQHLHRQAARRARHAGPGAQRAVRAAAAARLPEIVDFYLPPEACSYRMAVVRIRRPTPATPGVMMGVWSHLRQFMYTKFIVWWTRTWTRATGRK
jgi:4-hydroxy-3-polyprenylbenzoate decarboxylase